jgi:hypothetical protein
MGFLSPKMASAMAPAPLAASPPATIIMQPPPDASAAEIAAAREDQRKISAARRGNQANWLTGSTGLTAPAPVAQKILFGQ